MKKSDLRSGMIVVNRKGRKGIVLLNSVNGDILGGGLSILNNTWMPLSSLDDNLNYIDYPNQKDSDIIKVYVPLNNKTMGSFDINNSHAFKLLWERKEETIELTIELTIDEIAEKFNVPVENIKIKK